MQLTIVAILEAPLDISNRGLFQMPFYPENQQPAFNETFSLLTYMMCSMLRDIANTEGRMLVNSAFLRNSFPLFSRLRKNSEKPKILTVRSLISVDFPAPLGPTTPTRLRDWLLINETRFFF